MRLFRRRPRRIEGVPLFCPLCGPTHFTMLTVKGFDPRQTDEQGRPLDAILWCATHGDFKLILEGPGGSRPWFDEHGQFIAGTNVPGP